MALNTEISESLPTLENVSYPRDEESDSKRRDDEAGKFDDKPDNRIHNLMTRDSSQRESLNKKGALASMAGKATTTPQTKNLHD